MVQKEKTNWVHHVAQWRQSGKSKREYCAEQTLNTHTFDYHVYKQKQDERNEHDAEKQNPFTRIEVAQQEVYAVEKIELHFADGRKVFLPLNISHKTLRTIFLMK